LCYKSQILYINFVLERPTYHQVYAVRSTLYQEMYVYRNSALQ